MTVPGTPNARTELLATPRSTSRRGPDTYPHVSGPCGARRQRPVVDGAPVAGARGPYHCAPQGPNGNSRTGDTQLVELVRGPVRVRDLVQDDLEGMIATWTDPQVARFMGTYGPRTSDQVQAWLADTIEHESRSPRTSHNCAIELTASRNVAGWIGVGRSRTPIGEHDFGYALAEAHRGFGYAREALIAVLQFCFQHLHSASVWGECQPANLASARVMAGAGMVQIEPSAHGDVRFLAEAKKWRPPVAGLHKPAGPHG